MKHIKEKLKNNKKIIIGFLIGFVLTSTTVFAATILFDASETQYYHTGLEVENVEEALDYLYEYAGQCVSYQMPSNYAFGKPTASSTSDYDTLGKTVFAGRKASTYNGQTVERYAVCIKRNRARTCFYNNDYEVESKHLLEFNSYTYANCSVTSTETKCVLNDHACSIKTNGDVACTNASNQGCTVYANNNVTCGTLTIN